MIKIKTKEKVKGIQQTRNICVENEDGAEIKRIMSIKIDMQPDDLVKATLVIGVSELDILCHDQRIYKDSRGKKYILLEDVK